MAIALLCPSRVKITEKAGGETVGRHGMGTPRYGAMTDIRMERRNLGRTGLSVSVIGFGCSRIAGPKAAHDRNEISNSMAAERTF